MSYPYFKLGLGGGRGVPGEAIPTRSLDAFERPDLYEPDARTSHAVNAALALGRPLLVTGDPGVGKTQLAYAVAHNLGLEDASEHETDLDTGAPKLIPRVHKFETKSTSQARDLFYSFDAVSALQNSAAPRNTWVRFEALGRAIVEAFPADQPELMTLLTPEERAAHLGPRRAVVLIDEVDKAPRDFANDLLNEIDRLYFRVPELQRAASPGADGGAGVPSHLRPIVILTSNSERTLPEPFLRRCLYCHIERPTDERLRKIVERRIGALPGPASLAEDAIDLFKKLGGAKLRKGERGITLGKAPSTAELLDFLRLLGARIEGGAARDGDLFVDTLFALAKNRMDAEEAEKFVRDEWAASRGLRLPQPKPSQE